MRSAVRWSALFLVAMACGAAAAESPLAGDWIGTLEAQGQNLRLALHVSAAPGGGLQATFDSLDQHASGIPVDEIRLELNIVRFSLKQAGATFQGKLIGDSIDGEFRQSGFAMKLVFHRGVAEGPKRPQNPAPPYPYISEEAEFENHAAHITLAGTFTIPREAQGAAKTRKPPAVVLIVGSGPNDRDESILGHKPFLVLADYLTRHGIAVLRYDKRGVGQSKGVYKTATSADFAADASAAVDSLLARSDIDHRRIGLIGHSEGGILAPMVAAERKDRLLLHNDAWSRYFLNYDPATALEKLKMPVLALIGGLDMQVAPDENLAAIAAALKKGGNDRFTTLRLPGLNHLFQTAVTGAPSEYGRIEETIAPVALETITQWIRRQTGLEKK